MELESLNSYGLGDYDNEAASHFEVEDLNPKLYTIFLVYETFVFLNMLSKSNIQFLEVRMDREKGIG